MYLKKILRLTAALLLAFSFAGCGSEGNSNTNGDLVLNILIQLSPGVPVANLTATATVTSGRTPNAEGIPVTFSAKQYGVDLTGALVTEERVQPKEIKTAAGGIAIWDANFPQKSYPTTLEVSASAGGITRVSQVTVAATAAP